MVNIRTLRTPKPPSGWELIEQTLNDLEEKMKEAVRAPHEGKRRNESLWPIHRLHHQRSRYIYEMFYKKNLISRELYDFCCDQKYADRNLISKWRKPESKYQIFRCIENTNTNFGTACVCRVPRKDLTNAQVTECVKCGCRGCASGD